MNCNKLHWEKKIRSLSCSGHRYSNYFWVKLRTYYSKVLSISRAILCIWVMVLVTSLPAAVFHGEKVYPMRNGQFHSSCVFDSDKGYSKFSFHLSFFLTSCIVPLTVISVLYMGMVARLWKESPVFKVSSESRYVVSVNFNGTATRSSNLF